MMKQIGTFYVLDFDRCLGNVDANFNLLKKVVHELSVIDELSFQSARDMSESRGVSFSAFEYIRNYSSEVDLDVIEEKFIHYALTVKASLLETGAAELIDYLKATNREFCIMSSGEERWQKIKIKAAGFGSVPSLIVSNNKKSNLISKWQSQDSSKFIIPSFCFSDQISKVANEIVLVDDKSTAFESLPVGSRGYLVYGSTYSNNKPHLFCPVLQSVRQVAHVNEIIALE